MRISRAAVQSWGRNIALLAATLWAGALWGVGFLAVPVLFQTLPDKMLAGMLAGKMFTLVAYAGMACAGYLLVYLAGVSGKQAWRKPLLWIAAIMLLLALAGQFWIQPEMAALKALALPADVMHSPFADRFSVLHHLATAMYAVQSLLGIALVLKARHC